MSPRTSAIAVGASIATVLIVEAAVRSLRTRRVDANPHLAADLDDLARQGLMIVDLLAESQDDPGASSVPTNMLATAAQRSSELAAVLSRYESHTFRPRTAEAVAEMRQVTLRLGAALDAECTRRAVGPSDHEGAPPQLARRAAELDLAARELSAWSASDD